MSYALGIHRPRRSRPFTAEAVHRLDRLTSHLRRALHLRSKLQQAQADIRVGVATLDRFSFGVVQLTANGRLVNANRAALEIVEANDGLSLERLGLRAAFVSLLASGRALQAIAEKLGIGFETARTHLTRARAKTGTSSQVDLVRTVLTALLPTARSSP